MECLKEIHDLHVWGMSTTQVALTAHIVRDKTHIDDHFLLKISDDLHKQFSIAHTTIQIETGTEEHVCELGHTDSI